MQDKDIVIYGNSPNITRSGGSFKKPILISIIIILVMIIATEIILAVTPKATPPTVAAQKEDENSEIAYFTKAQNLFVKLCGKQLTVKYIKEDYFKDDDDIILYLPNKREGRIRFKGSAEIIKFDIIHEEDDSPDTAVNFMYSEVINGKELFVFKSGENAYQHFNGYVTNEFERVEDAIRDHQLFQK